LNSIKSNAHHEPRGRLPCVESALLRILLQKLKVAAALILGENLKRKRSVIRIASVALPKSPLNLA